MCIISQVQSSLRGSSSPSEVVRAGLNLELVYTGRNLTLMSSETFRDFSARFVCRWVVVAQKALRSISVRILEQNWGVSNLH